MFNFTFSNILIDLVRILGIFVLAYLIQGAVIRFFPKLLGEGFALMKKTGLTSEEQRNNKRKQTILNALLGFTKTSIWVIAIMMVLSEFGVNITPIIASAGILGLAIGFGAQTLVKDFINGVFILWEDQFGEGDLIKIEGYEGKVERMSLRSTILRDLDGVVHTIPNSRISSVSNLSRQWSRVNLDLQFSSSITIDEALKMLRNVSHELMTTKKMESMVMKDPEVLGIEGIDLTKYVIKVIIKTQALKQFDVARKYRYLFKKEMEKVSIR